VLGGENTGYETKGMPYRVTLHPNAKSDDRLLQGVDVSDIVGHQSLYQVLPLAPDATPLLVGTAMGIEPAQPVAWTRIYGPAQARIFYTSLGAPGEAAGPAFRRLVMNAVQWTLKL
jgi:type 1 glutamine amidotransferase